MVDEEGTGELSARGFEINKAAPLVQRSEFHELYPAFQLQPESAVDKITATNPHDTEAPSQVRRSHDSGNTSANNALTTARIPR